MACFAVLALLAATPCAMAVGVAPPSEAAHDCPHCPPTTDHDLVEPMDCDSSNPADKPRQDGGAELIAPGSMAMSGMAQYLPLWQTRAPGPPPARDGPRRHLILATFNE